MTSTITSRIIGETGARESEQKGCDVTDEESVREEEHLVFQFYRTIKRPMPTRDDFLSDKARGNDPPRNLDK